MAAVEKDYSAVLDEAKKRKEQAQIPGSKEYLEDKMKNLEDDYACKIQELTIQHNKAIVAKGRASTKIVAKVRADCRVRNEIARKAIDARVNQARVKYEEQLDATQQDFNKKIEDLKYKYKEQQKIQTKACEKKMADEQERSDKRMRTKIESWEKKMDDLKKKHSEQVAKGKAGSKMVEAAKKFVEMNVGEGDGQADQGGVVVKTQ